MNKNSQEMLKELIQNVLQNKKIQEDFIDVKNLFVAFINDNTFRFCNEVKKEGKSCTAYELVDCFNNVIVTFVVGYTSENIKRPWRSNDMFESFDEIDKIIAFPIKSLLGNHVLKDITTKKNISNLYNIIDEYIKENPYFIHKLFNENNEKKLKK